MVFKAIILLICLEVIAIHCELFCDSPVIESAITVKDSTYLFRNHNYWIWNHTTNHIAPDSEPINKTFIAEYKEPQESEFHRLSQIDAIFSTVMRSDSYLKLLYIFTKDEYYFLSVSNSCSNTNSGICFPALISSDSISIPKGWRYYGGKLSNWFPNKISATLPFGENVILFYENKARFIKLNTDPNEPWPDNETLVMNFRSIDDIFEIPFTEDIVMTDSSNYCRFNKRLLNVTPVPSAQLDIPCDWKPNKYLFLCEKEPIPTTPSTTSPIIIQITTKTSINTTLEEIQSKPIKDVSNKTTISTIESDINFDTKTTTESNKSDENVLILVFVMIFVVLIIVLSISVIGIAYCLSSAKNKTKYGTSGTPTIRSGQESVVSLDSGSMASIVTVDTQTGEPRDSNS